MLYLTMSKKILNDGETVGHIFLSKLIKLSEISMKVLQKIHSRLKCCTFAATTTMKQDAKTSNMNECCGWDIFVPPATFNNTIFFVTVI